MNRDEFSIIETMKILQKHASDLESANRQFRREISVYRRKINSLQDENQNNDVNIYDQVTKTNQMIAAATETLRDIRILKRENHSLASEIKSAEKELNDLLADNLNLSKEINITSLHLDQDKKIVEHYNSFLLQILLPQHSKQGKITVKFNSAVKTTNILNHSSKMQTLLQELKQLPNSFNSQPLNIKESMIKTLCSAKETINTLQFEMGLLKQKRIINQYTASQINEKEQYISVIAQAMNRISF